MLFSCILSCANCPLMVDMKSMASAMGTAAVKGPLVSKSSAKVDTVFLKSSAEWRRFALNFSYRYVYNQYTVEWPRVRKSM